MPIKRILIFDIVLFPLFGLFASLVHLNAISVINIIPHYRRQVKGKRKIPPLKGAEILFYQWIVRQILLTKRADLGAEGVKRAAERADDAYGFVFLFFSHEHEPIHVHVRGHNGEAKYIWDGDGFVLDSARAIKNNDLKRIERAIHENSDIILNRWYEIFGDIDNNDE